MNIPKVDNILRPVKSIFQETNKKKISLTKKKSSVNLREKAELHHSVNIC